MTTVSPGATDSFTLTHDSILSINVGYVDVTVSGARIFGSLIHSAQNIGPFPVGASVNVSALTATVQYTIIPFQLASTAGIAGSMRDRAATRYAVKRLTNLPLLNFVGDSYPAAGGASSTPNGFAQLLATELSSVANISNYGWAGYPCQKYSSAPLLSGAGAANASVIQIALDSITDVTSFLNDVRGIGQAGGVTQVGCGPNPDNFANLRSKVQAMATHFLIPETNKVRARTLAQDAINPALTYVGSWTQALNGNPNFVYTTGSATISGITAFGNLLILRIGRDSAEDNYWTLTIDGVTQPRIYCRSDYDGWSQDCVIIPLPTRAVHTFVLTAVIVSGDGANVFESIDCVDTTSDFSATLQYTTPIFLNDGSNIGWGLTSVTANSASVASATGEAAWSYGNGACLRFSAEVDEAMRELYELGFNVVKADALPGWNRTAHLNADTIHPNDYGHGRFYQAKRSFLRRLLIA